MPKAVKFDKYGRIEGLRVVEVERPVPGAGQVLVQVKAAGINPGQAAIREGVFAQRWLAKFPSGQGSDFAGVVKEVGRAVASYRPGDEVIGFTNDRASQADFVVGSDRPADATPAPRTVGAGGRPVRRGNDGRCGGSGGRSIGRPDTRRLACRRMAL